MIQVPSQGLTDLAIIVEIAKDPKKFDEAVTTLRDAREKLYETVEQKAKLANVDKLLAEANMFLSESKIQAGKLTQEANDRKLEGEQLFAAREKKLVEDEVAFAKQRTQFETDSSKLSIELDGRDKRLLTKETGLTAREKKLTEREHEVTDLLMKNKELNANLSDALKRLGVAS